MITKLDHLGIKVSDMDRSLQFYTAVLGLELTERRRFSEDTELAFLSPAGQPAVSVELVCSPGVVDRVGVVNHLAFEVDNIEEMLEVLEQAGMDIVDRKPIVIPGQKIAFFWGPDGEKLELVEKK